MTREHKNPGSNDGPNANHHQVRGGEGTLERGFTGGSRLLLELTDTFAGEKTHGGGVLLR
jgi:hypothetical protein